MGQWKAAVSGPSNETSAVMPYEAASTNGWRNRLSWLVELSTRDMEVMKLVSIQYAELIVARGSRLVKTAQTREWLSQTSACNNLNCSRKDDPTRLIMETELPHDTWRQGWYSGERPMLCKQLQAIKLKTRTWVSDRRNPSQESQLSRRQCQPASQGGSYHV